MLYKRISMCLKIVFLALILVNLPVSFAQLFANEPLAKQDFAFLKTVIHERMASGVDNGDIFFELRKLGYDSEKHEVLSFVISTLQNLGKKIAPAPLSRPALMYSIEDLISPGNSNILIEELKDSYNTVKSKDTLIKLLHLMNFNTDSKLDKSIENYLDKLRDNYPEEKFAFTYYSGLYSLRTGSHDEARKYFLDAITETIDRYSQAEIQIRAATIYKQSGKYAEAVKLFSQAYELINEFSPLDNYLIRKMNIYDPACLDYAIALNQEGNYWAAVYYYRKLPLNETALYDMSELFLGNLKNKTNARQTIGMLKTINLEKYNVLWKRFLKTNWEVDSRYPINELLTR